MVPHSRPNFEGVNGPPEMFGPPVEDVELVFLPYAFQGVEEDRSGVVVVEVWETVVTTEGDEVVVAEGVVVLEVARHGWDEYIWVPRSWTFFVHERGWGFLDWIRWWYGHPPPLMPQSARHERGTHDGDRATRHLR